MSVRVRPPVPFFGFEITSKIVLANRQVFMASYEALGVIL
jgi:hypothetical protein